MVWIMLGSRMTYKKPALFFLHVVGILKCDHGFVDIPAIDIIPAIAFAIFLSNSEHAKSSSNEHHVISMNQCTGYVHKIISPPANEHDRLLK